MKYDPQKHHRRSIRLKDYDYSQPGAYFVTLCTHNRKCSFGDVVEGKIELNELGKIVEEEWRNSAKMRREIELDVFVVMPNHFHGIVVIRDPRPVGATGRSPLHPYRRTLSPKSLGSFIAGFKSAVTHRMNELRQTPGASIWQRNYYEHVVRNEIDLEEIHEYIVNNPFKWLEDENHPANIKTR